MASWGFGVIKPCSCMEKNKYDKKYVQNFWSYTLDVVGQAVLVIFLSMTMFPRQALAFVDTVERHQQTLVFVRDPSLEGKAIIGIEEWPKERTVAKLLSSSSLSVKYLSLIHI